MDAQELARRSSSPSAPDDLRVLVIEDEANVGVLLESTLRARGYSVHVAPTGVGGMDWAAVWEPDLVILDLGLPDVDGIEVCRLLRRWYSNPIVVLSADGAEDRKIRALDEGANDYVTKPFSMPELLARLRVAVRHRELVASIVDPAVIEVGDVRIDTGARTVTADGEHVELTRKEFELITLLACSPGKVLTHRAILGRVWGTSGSTETLRTHMAGLRRKLGSGDDRPRVLSEPGVGYRLVIGPD